jgi:hypothetical protein
MSEGRCVVPSFGVDLSAPSQPMKEKNPMGAMRRSNRYRVVINIPVRLGLKDGTLVDVSQVGALVTHGGALSIGYHTNMTFMHNGRKFAGPVTVQYCNVVGIGAAADGGTLFASRVYFSDLSEDALQIIEAILTPAEGIEN